MIMYCPETAANYEKAMTAAAVHMFAIAPTHWGWLEQ
jgi:hypothetical protein